MTNKYQERRKFNGFRISEDQEKILDYFRAGISGDKPLVISAGVQHLAHLAGEIGAKRVNVRGEYSLAEILILRGTLASEENREFFRWLNNKGVTDEETLIEYQERILVDAVRRLQENRSYVNQYDILAQLKWKYLDSHPDSTIEYWVRRNRLPKDICHVREGKC